MSKRSPPRPVFFNLMQIQMPVGALTSIAHRVTGIVLVLGIPFCFYALDLSLDSAQSYERLAVIASTGVFKATLILFISALSHQRLAGVRHLVMVIGVGSRLTSARPSAWSVNVGGIAVALLVAGVVL
jgi:succinate dehydrogenase / fumarate reductase cytochrome b subunit